MVALSIGRDFDAVWHLAGVDHVVDGPAVHSCLDCDLLSIGDEVVSALLMSEALEPVFRLEYTLNVCQLSLEHLIELLKVQFPHRLVGPAVCGVAHTLLRVPRPHTCLGPRHGLLFRCPVSGSPTFLLNGAESVESALIDEVHDGEGLALRPVATAHRCVAVRVDRKEDLAGRSSGGLLQVLDGAGPLALLAVRGRVPLELAEPAEALIYRHGRMRALPIRVLFAAVGTLAWPARRRRSARRACASTAAGSFHLADGGQ